MPQYYANEHHCCPMTHFSDLKGRPQMERVDAERRREEKCRVTHGNSFLFSKCCRQTPWKVFKDIKSVRLFPYELHAEELFSLSGESMTYLNAK